MKLTKSLLLGGFSCLAATSLHAVTINWDGGGADNVWTTPENWSDDLAPSAGVFPATNDYVADAATVSSPSGVDTVTFAGDSLTVQNGATLRLYRANGGATKTVTHTIPGLTVNNSQIRPESQTATCYHHLATPVAFTGTNTLWMNENSGYTMNFYFDAAITGSGSIAITRDATGSGRSVFFNGDTSGFSGDVSLASSVAETLTAIFSDANGWGSGTLTLGSYSTADMAALVSQPGAGLVLSTATSYLELPAGTTSLGSVTQDAGEIRLDLEGGTPAVEHLSIAGDFVANGGKIVLDVKVVPDTGVPYTLVTYGGNMATQPVIEIIDTANSALVPTIDYGDGADGVITVTFDEFVGLPAELVWTGANSDAWDVETTQNWSDGGSPAVFAQFDNVTFDDSVGIPYPTVTLDTAVTPTEFTIDADTSEYLITGSGSIAGTCYLTKDGAAEAIIATDNAYDGGTDIYAGTLVVGTGGTTGSLGTGSVANDTMLVFNRSNTLTFPNVISSTGSVEQAGSGTLVLTGGSSYTGGTLVSSGTLQLGDGSSNSQSYIATSSGITVSGGTVLELPRLHAITTQNIALVLPDVALADGSTMRFRAQTGSNIWNIDASADLTVSGSVTIDNTGGSYAQDININGTVSGTGTISYLTANSGASTTVRTMALKSAASTFAGDWFVQHANTGNDYGALRADAAGALGTGTVTLSTRARLVNNIANGIDTLAGVMLEDEEASILSSQDATLASVGGTAGSIRITAGTFTLSAAGIPDESDVRVATGAVLNLPFTGTDVVRDFYIDDVAQASGTWGAEGSGADHETALITGAGKIQVAVSDPYLAWIDTFYPGETDENIIGLGADPDNDGGSNALEFATNGNPASGASSGKVVGAVADVSGEDALTLTLPVLSGAVFSGAAEQTATVGTITYRIQGNEGDLVDWTSAVVSEVSPALSSGLPALDAGWEYRTFRMAGAVGSDPSDFLRAVVETP
ncbi:MAG: autotransporter-associated beta strand repeat-containing protein [Akkermansiaceae bacterium]|nr:autotransporter-associated beta strand repeat-containing protein [Akkermansiaceae bacterium]